MNRCIKPSALLELVAPYAPERWRGNRGLKKNNAQLHTLFALSSLWMARKAL